MKNRQGPKAVNREPETWLGKFLAWIEIQPWWVSYPIGLFFLAVLFGTPVGHFTLFAVFFAAFLFFLFVVPLAAFYVRCKQVPKARRKPGH